MEKKIVLALLMVTLLAGGAFAQMSMSGGLGGSFAMNFSNYAFTSDGKDAMIDGPGVDADSYDSYSVGGGFFAFFDATYAMATLGMGFYSHYPANADAKKAMDDAKETNLLTTFNIGLYGKYPIDMGGMTLFPMLGVEFILALDQQTTVDGETTKYSDGDPDDPIGDFYNSVWFKIGVGIDIPVGDSMYVRPTFMYGIGTNSKVGQEFIDKANEDKKLYDVINHGFDIGVSVGFKF